MCVHWRENFAKITAISFFLFFSAAAGHCNDQQIAFNDAASHLVNSILGRASFPAAVSLEVTNASSLSAAEVSAIRTFLAAQFPRNQAQIVVADRAVAEIRVTLTEDVHEYLWVAEAKHGEQREVAMVPVPRMESKSLPGMAAMVSLRKTLLWSQSGAPVLDATLLDKGGRLLVLDSSTLSMYRNQQSHWELEQSQPIAHSHTWPRDVRGRLIMLGEHKLETYLPGKKCAGTADPGVSLECHDSDDPWPIGEGRVRAFFGARNSFTGAVSGWKESSIAPFYSAATTPGGETLISAGTDGWLRAGENRLANGSGDDIAIIQSECGSYLLMTEAGDSSVNDSLRIAEVPTARVMQQAAPLEFPGPVTALWNATERGSITAVVKNLNRGRYEAYLVSLTCR